MKHLSSKLFENGNNAIAAYLKSVTRITSGKQRLYYGWVLHNVEYWHQVRNEADDMLIDRVGAMPKLCYRNSAVLALSDSRYQYYEGWVEVVGVAIEHAWNVKDGEIYDTTFGALWKEKPQYECLNNYGGIHIPTEFLEQNMSYTGGDILQRYYRDL